jgi:DNA invertase Pin-like site-specific DNA recombinase
MKTIIYSRCSTDEKKQDVDTQLKQLRQRCKAYEWDFDEVSEYGSGYKGDQPKLKGILAMIKAGEYQAIMVYSLDRFSREHPKKVNALLDQIVYDYKCRFISLMEGIDSNNEMTWHIIRPMFAYFANIFSRNLSEKIKCGIRNKKDKGVYHGGRPVKKVDVDRFQAIWGGNGKSLRTIAQEYNEGLPKK